MPTVKKGEYRVVRNEVRFTREEVERMIWDEANVAAGIDPKVTVADFRVRYEGEDVVCELVTEIESGT